MDTRSQQVRGDAGDGQGKDIKIGKKSPQGVIDP